MKTKVGELWRSTGTIHIGLTRAIPPGALLLVVARGELDYAGESRVIWEGGTGWISDQCVLWEPVNEAG
jgi:hypothetical protein